MNDIIALQDRILAADINDPFDETNYIELFLEKESAKKNRRARKATAKVQKKRLNIIAKAEGLVISNPVEQGKNRNHATYTHIDFQTDGCCNRIINKEAKGEISGWRMPLKRSKTWSLAQVNQLAYAEVEEAKAEAEYEAALAAKWEHYQLVEKIKNMGDLAKLEIEKEWNAIFEALAVKPINGMNVVRQDVDMIHHSQLYKNC